MSWSQSWLEQAPFGRVSSTHAADSIGTGENRHCKCCDHHRSEWAPGRLSMIGNQTNRAPAGSALLPPVTSELNNLIQIIAGTSELMENIWEGTEGSEKYFAMLRASILRAEQVTAQLVRQAGGVDAKVAYPSVPESVTSKIVAQARSHSVLVVDDEQMVLSLFRRILTEEGYEFTSAQSGFECLDLFRREAGAYDLVLLDLAMPVMDGEETFTRLRRISPGVSVVLTTGFCEQERLDRMMKAGLNGYLRKPARNDEILAVVASVMAKAKPSRAID